MCVFVYGLSGGGRGMCFHTVLLICLLLYILLVCVKVCMNAHLCVKRLGVRVCVSLRALSLAQEEAGAAGAFD